MANLTNSEIINSQPHLLTSLQRQVRFLMQQHLRQKPCPNCGELHNLPEARGVSIDEFDFGNSGSDRDYRCTKCKRTLIYRLPLIGEWHWALEHSEATLPADNP